MNLCVLIETLEVDGFLLEPAAVPLMEAALQRELQRCLTERTRRFPGDPSAARSSGSPIVPPDSTVRALARHVAEAVYRRVGE